MNRYAAEALAALGCDVTVFNHGRAGALDRFVRHCSRDWFNRRKSTELMQAVEAVKPDLFLTVYGKPYRRDLIEELNHRGIRTACWWLDDPFSFGTEAQDLGQAGAFHAYFSNCRGSLPDYRKAGVANARFLPVGIAPDVHRRIESETEYDVLFAGDWHPLRQQVLEELNEHFAVAIMGPWKERKIGRESPLNERMVQRGFFTPEEMVTAFNRAKVVLNLHTWYGRWHYGVNPRLFEAGGCGAFQVCDLKEEIPDFYRPSHEIVLYKDVAELPELVGHWLARPDERKRVALGGHRRSHNDHTYQHRMRELLREVGFPN